MKWVLISKTHFNMDNIIYFSWEEGKLYLHTGERELWKEDPDKKHYTKLCQLMGVRPYEEVRDDT